MGDWFLKIQAWLEDHLNWKVLAVVLVIVAVVAFCGGNLYQDWRAQGEGLTLVEETPSAPDESTSETDATDAEAGGEVVVHVAGAVSAPGVYTLPEGSRVDDAVRKAGATGDADLSQLNLAQLLSDGQKITVPTVNQAPATTEGTASSTPSDSTTSGGLININTASQEELETLPSIGQARAQAIITYRENNGGFKTIEEIKEVSGIGEKIFEDVSPHITV